MGTVIRCCYHEGIWLPLFLLHEWYTHIYLKLKFKTPNSKSIVNRSICILGPVIFVYRCDKYFRLRIFFFEAI